MNLWNWLLANYKEMGAVLAALGMIVEGLNRMFPSKKSESVLEKIGKGIRFLMDLCKVPDVKYDPAQVGMKKLALHKKKKDPSNVA